MTDMDMGWNPNLPSAASVSSSQMDEFMQHPDTVAELLKPSSKQQQQQQLGTEIMRAPRKLGAAGSSSAPASAASSRPKVASVASSSAPAYDKAAYPSQFNAVAHYRPDQFVDFVDGMSFPSNTMGATAYSSAAPLPSTYNESFLGGNEDQAIKKRKAEAAFGVPLRAEISSGQLSQLHPSRAAELQEQLKNETYRWRTAQKNWKEEVSKNQSLLRNFQAEHEQKLNFERDLIAVNDRLQEEERTSAKYLAAGEKLNKESVEDKKALAQLDADLAAANAARADLQARLQEAQQQNRKSDSEELSAAHVQVDAAVAAKTAADAALDLAKTALASQAREIDRLGKVIASNITANKQLRAHIESELKLKTQLESANTKLLGDYAAAAAAVEQRNRNWDAHLAQDKLEMAGLQKQWDELVAQKNGFEQQIPPLTAQIAGHDAQVRALQAKIDSDKTAEEARIKELTAAQEAARVAKEDKAAVKSLHSKLEADYETAVASNKVLQDQHAILTGNVIAGKTPSQVQLVGLAIRERDQASLQLSTLQNQYQTELNKASFTHTAELEKAKAEYMTSLRQTGEELLREKREAKHSKESLELLELERARILKEHDELIKQRRVEAAAAIEAERKLKKELADLEGKDVELNEQLKAAKASADSKDEQLEILRQKRVASVSVSSLDAEEKAEFEQQISELKRRAKEATLERLKVDSAAAAKLRESQAKVRGIQSELKTATALKEEAEARLAEANARVRPSVASADASGSNELLTHQIATFKQRVQSLETELHSVKEAKSDLEGQISSLNLQLALLQQDKKRKDESIADLRARSGAAALTVMHDPADAALVDDLQRSLQQLQLENNELHQNQRRRHISPQRDSRVDDLRSQLDTAERDYKRLKHEKQRLQEELDELRERAARRPPSDYYSGPPAPLPFPAQFSSPSPAGHWNQQIFVSPGSVKTAKSAPSGGLFPRGIFVTDSVAAQPDRSSVSGRDAAQALNESLQKSDAEDFSSAFNSSDSSSDPQWWSDLNTYVQLNERPRVASDFLTAVRDAKASGNREQVKELYLTFANHAVQSNNRTVLQLLANRGMHFNG